MKRHILILALLACATLRAEVKPFPLFSDHMVLQQSSNVKIWGTAAPSKDISLTASWNNNKFVTRSDESGNWEVELRTPSWGGPYEISIQEGKKTRKNKPLVLSDVMIGEVWLCGGQSNMQMRVGDNIIGMDKTLQESVQQTDIRLARVEIDYGPSIADDVKLAGDGWQTCNPESVKEFSAAGYHFGLELQRELGVPVGLIESCLGGTIAEAWISRESLGTMPYFKTSVEGLAGFPATKEEQVAKFEKELDEWRVKMSTEEAQPSYDCSGWETMNVPGFIQHLPGYANFGGFFWLRRSFEIPAEWAGRELILNVAGIDDYDFTYFNGVEIGHTENLGDRQYKVPAKLVKAGEAVVAIRVMDNGGLGGVWPNEGNFSIAPEGCEPLSIRGEWKLRTIKGLYEEPVFPINTSANPNYPTFLYNSMIAPITDFTIKGAIWYQGESNSSAGEMYKDLLPLLICDWRAKWGYDFPFYIAQLANYQQEQTEAEVSGWAAIREAQLQTSQTLEDTGLAVLIDIGEANDIHPKNKPECGRRLALAALAQTYGKTVEYTGPLYSGYRIEGGAIRISFTHADGLRIAPRDKEVKGFWIAGVDHVFHKAEARIDGQTVVVRSAEVPMPVAVRYGWADNPPCNLYNSAMLPASPFRTDSYKNE